MSLEQRNKLEELFNKFSEAAAAYRKEIALSNRPQPGKLVSERLAELALAKLLTA